MKRVTTTLMISLAMILSLAAFTQTTDKDAEKAMKSKAYKQARKDAKTYEKDGYYVALGALPLEKQLENAWKTIHGR